ncbi:MAG: malto-oligosyltrehalose synthase [Kofleriaceae bacterium]
MAPRASYRLQLTPGFGFREAARVVPYLAELGISHLYLSPVLQAAEGSTHGYDVVDPSRVSADLGGEDAFAALVTAARDAGLAILLDIVPNHMSIAGARNGWWLDVLENGPASYYATFFDVDWSATSDDRVLLPILGERYGRALANGQLSIVWAQAPVVADAAYPTTFWVHAGEHRIPVSPRSVGTIVRRAGERIEHAELAYVGEALASLPSSHERAAQARLRRHRHRGVLLRRLDEIARATSIREAIEAELAAINKDPIALDAILEAQNYRLAHWSVAGNQLTYRRFFDVTSLVGVRVEDPDVFTARHARVLQWLADGTIDGIRVDHVDGLRDPAGYLERLRTAAGDDRWIVVEKILAPHEDLPASWPVDGTTGYDFMDLVGRLFVDPAGEAALTHTFTAYTGDAWDPEAARRAARREVMTDALHSELVRLTELAIRACATSPACRDYTRGEIEDSLAEILAHYPVYRTYLGTRAIDTTVRVTRLDGPPAARTSSRSRLEEFIESRRATEKIVTLEREETDEDASRMSPIGSRSEETTAPLRPWREEAPSAPLASAARASEEPHSDLFGALPEATTEKRRSRDRMRVADLVAEPRRATGTPPDGMPAIARPSDGNEDVTTERPPVTPRTSTRHGAPVPSRTSTRDATPIEPRTPATELVAPHKALAPHTGTGEPLPHEVDRARIAEAFAGARRARPDLDPDLLAFLEAALAFELPSPEAQELAVVAQQSTGPIVAKGDEDTLGYRAVRLLARCEVGADVAQLATAPEDVHARLAIRRTRDMNATSTHDTKRGEDVRARIAVLSEIPAVWDAAVSSWGERAAAWWGDVERDRVFELAMWQTLVGAWPLSVERAQRFAEKATREARTRTSWRKPDERYETARRAWIDRIYKDRALLDEIAQLAARIEPHGDRNSLAMLLVKLVAPGVPDFYQGSELRVATLVDPDNRDRYEPRAPTSELDRAKLDVTRRVLALRRQSPQLFDGAYRALAARGPHADRVFAFARGDDLVAVVPRLGVGAPGWPDTTLSLEGTWTDVLSERHFTGGAHPLAEIWSRRSVALLLRSTT